MAMPSTHEITDLLLAWSNGDKGALEQLTPLVHQELHRLARVYMRGEGAGHTLQTTALIHEAYLRLIAPAGCAGRTEPISLPSRRS